MTRLKKIGRASLGTAVAAALAASIAAAVPTQAGAQPSGAVAPANNLTLSQGTGRLIQLPGPATDVFVANDTVADVYIRSGNQLYVFGKGPGQSSVYATDSSGRVLYSANVRVGANLGSVDELLRMAMPDAEIRATPMAGTVLLTGTVREPADVEEAQRIVQAFLGEGTQVISRLRTATPMQVMLQVRIAEVSRSLARDIGVNLTSLDRTAGDFQFGIGRGGDSGSFDDTGSFSTLRNAGSTAVNLIARNVLGVDIAGTLDLNENSGLVTTLAEPMLSALSGETASFLAGGEFPIPTAQGIGGTSVEFKQYGVSLAFTPIVLEGGRISMRVRPEVSELSTEGAIRLNGFTVPSLVTRRAETTVELGSGQSFMIAGLLRNTGANSVERTPGLGRLPIIGALFRSNGFRRNETELVIVVTPYLVRPVNARDIALPTDGFHNAPTAGRVLLDQQHSGRSGEQRPVPVVATPQTVAPGVGPIGAVQPAPRGQTQQQAARPAASPAPAPGFNF
ncbi:MAG TPA: type II and III secretion system protein family protein [Allosphingosinicella sp.]|nr:type II and III secretion system protein family protein [Allosphingosinicella sp.]